VIRQSMIKDFLKKILESYGVMKLTPKGKLFMEDPYEDRSYKDHDLNAEWRTSIRN